MIATVLGLQDATFIAILGLVTTLIAGLAGSAIGAWAQQASDNRKYEHDRLTRDFDEVRVLLDDAAQVIWRYITDLREAEKTYLVTDDVAAYASARDAVAETRNAAYALNQRLVIRLGRRHEVLRAYGSSLRSLDVALTGLGDAMFVHGSALDLRLAHHEGLADRMSGWWERYEAFLDAATALAASPVQPLKASGES